MWINLDIIQGNRPIIGYLLDFRTFFLLLIMNSTLNRWVARVSSPPADLHPGQRSDLFRCPSSYWTPFILLIQPIVFQITYRNINIGNLVYNILEGKLCLRILKTFLVLLYTECPEFSFKYKRWEKCNGKCNEKCIEYWKVFSWLEVDHYLITFISCPIYWNSFQPKLSGIGMVCMCSVPWWKVALFWWAGDISGIGVGGHDGWSFSSFASGQPALE